MAKLAVISTLLSILALSSNAQIDLASKEKELVSLQKIVHQWVDSTSNISAKSKVNPYDSIAKYDSTIALELDELSLKCPDIFNWGFHSFDSAWAPIFVLTSTDKNFRLYSWDNMQGGTMRSYDDILSYRSKHFQKADYYIAENGKPDNERPVKDYCTLFYDLLTVKVGKKYFYLAAFHNQYASCSYYDGVQVFTIDSSGLNDTVKLIKTSSGMKNSIVYEWKATGQYHYKGGGDYDIHVELDQKRQTIKIPVVFDDGHVTKRYIEYRFNGKYFEKAGIIPAKGE